MGTDEESRLTAPAASVTVTDVIARMVQIDAELPRKDGVAYFNRLYLQVTRAVLAGAADMTFADPPSPSGSTSCSPACTSRLRGRSAQLSHARRHGAR